MQLPVKLKLLLKVAKVKPLCCLIYCSESNVNNGYTLSSESCAREVCRDSLIPTSVALGKAIISMCMEAITF